MRAYLPELAIDSLLGRVTPDDPEYMHPDEAWQALREDAPEDFGDDLAKWDAWVEQRYRSLRHKAIDAED